MAGQPITGDPLDFEGTLGVLMDRLGERVRISFFAAHTPKPTQAQVADVEGVLTAGWDQDVLAANGFEGSAIFRVEGAPGFSLYLVRGDFEDAYLNANGVFIRTGGVAVSVQPPFFADPPAA